MTATAPPATGSAPARPLTPSRTTATAARVLRQLTHDPRTIALLVIVPVLLITLLRYVFDGAAGDLRRDRGLSSASSR